MGNQVDKASESQKTQKTQNKITKKSDIKVNNKTKPVKKENLYAEDKLFENFESKNFYIKNSIRHKHLWISPRIRPRRQRILHQLSLLS
jgi:hypothetical protein